MIWPTLVTLMAAAVVALFIDHLFGEPPVRWHPVVWMGHALGWAGKRVAPLAAEAPVGRDGRAFWHGTLHWLVLSAGVVLTATGLQWALYQLPVWLAAVGLGLCLKPLLAWRMLRTEVLAVEAALGESLAAGRERLGWLVRRDVGSLTEAQVLFFAKLDTSTPTSARHSIPQIPRRAETIDRAAVDIERIEQ